MTAEVNADVPGEQLACGTVFNNEGDLAGMSQDDQLSSIVGKKTDHEGTCKDAISDRKIWTIPLAILGVVVLLGGILIRTRPSTPTPI